MPKWMLDLKTWGNRSREEYEEIQNRKLREFLTEQLRPFSPYYRRFFEEHKIDPRKIKTTKDLVHIPFTSKADIVPRPRDFLLQPDKDLIRRYWPKTRLLELLVKKQQFGETALEDRFLWEYWPLMPVFTTGRTADPTPFVYTGRDLETFMEIGRRSFQLAQAPRKLAVVDAFPSVPHLGYWSSVWFTYAAGIFCVHLGGVKLEVRTEKILSALAKLTVEGGLGATPGYARYLFRTALDQGMKFPYLTRLGTGGERMPPGLRKELHALMKELNGGKETFVASTYGFTEAKEAWFECYETTRGWEENTGFHTHPDVHSLELINPQTGERVGEGEEGEIVYTPLDWRGTCVFRYRTGDVCREGLTWEPCPHCGRTVPRLGSTIARRSDLKECNTTKIKSTLVDLGSFYFLMGEPGVAEWQVLVCKEGADSFGKGGDRFGRDELRVYIAIHPGFEPEPLKEEIARKISSATEVTPNVIEILLLEELYERLGMETELKENRISDTRPKD